MRYLLTILPFLLLTSCGNGKTKMNDEIKKQEAEVQKNRSKDKVQDLFKSYDKFITAYPLDTMSKNYAYNGAEMGLIQQDAESALKFINLFLKNYPDDPRAAEMQYKKGLVYDLLVHDGLRAAAEYEIFVKKYPSHPLRQSAENAMLLIQDPGAFMNSLKTPQDTGSASTQNR